MWIQTLAFQRAFELDVRGTLYRWRWPLVLLGVAYVAGPYAMADSEYRPDPDQLTCERPRAEMVAQGPADGGPVFVIRLTDEGELVDRCSVTDVLLELDGSAYPGSEIILLYIHGWLHNADPTDSNRIAFEGLVTRVDSLEKARALEAARRVVGVYVGWEATVFPGPLDYASFWGRTAASDRISQSAVVTKLIGSIRNARRIHDEQRTADGYDDRRDLMVLIGHSLGARILFTATQQVLLQNTQMQYPPEGTERYGVVQGPADAILLLNPAFGASTYTAMQTLRLPHRAFAIDQQPLLVTLASETDRVTQIGFPFGQWVGSLRRPRQMTTLGNYEAYISHDLRPAGPGQRPDRVAWFNDFCSGGICLNARDTIQPHNPFLIARASREIIDGHGDIWGDNLVDWVVDFMVELDRALVATRAPEASLR